MRAAAGSSRSAWVAAALLVCGSALLGGAADAGPREEKGAVAGDFDLYILALSWSPGFCASGGEAKAPEQCQFGSDLGFVVHGLWPQSERGYPTFCQPQGRFPQRSDIEQVRGVMPSEGLARHAWRKHGSCSGLPPSQYFASVAKVYSRIEIPAAFQAPTSDVESGALDIERAFAAANPGLRTDMTTVDCGRGQDGRTVLEEIRICLTKDLRGFRPCPDEVERSSCRARSMVMPKPR